MKEELTFTDIIGNAIDELERAYELLKDNTDAEKSMLLQDIEFTLDDLADLVK